jgi:hypothetical protein
VIHFSTDRGTATIFGSKDAAESEARQLRIGCRGLGFRVAVGKRAVRAGCMRLIVYVVTKTKATK